MQPMQERERNANKETNKKSTFVGGVHVCDRKASQESAFNKNFAWNIGSIWTTCRGATLWKDSWVQ